MIGLMGNNEDDDDDDDNSDPVLHLSLYVLRVCRTVRLVPHLVFR
jgi:hypothetical protein